MPSLACVFNSFDTKIDIYFGLSKILPYRKNSDRFCMVQNIVKSVPKNTVAKISILLNTEFGIKYRIYQCARPIWAETVFR